MQHFFRCHLHPDTVLSAADDFFPPLGLVARTTGLRSRSFAGELGVLDLVVRMEGGHYTFVEAHTDQTGESRLDRTVKRFFVSLHRAEHPDHALGAAY
jgi:hypothetical protein